MCWERGWRGCEAGSTLRVASPFLVAPKVQANSDVWLLVYGYTIPWVQS